jgi:hypothetical protein
MPRVGGVLMESLLKRADKYDYLVPCMIMLIITFFSVGAPFLISYFHESMLEYVQAQQQKRLKNNHP